MKIQDKIIKNLDELILQAGQFGAKIWTRDTGQMTDEHMDYTGFAQWNTQCLNLLTQIKNRHEIYLERFLEEELKGTGKKGRMPYHSTSVEVAFKVAILKALKSDIERGAFFDEELLITADAFSSVLEQAEYLLKENYKDAAAVLIGAVLESTLRKLCEKHGVTVPDNPKINILNDLLKDKAYNALMHKQIIAWADLRNNAAHGHFDKYKKEHVEGMLRWLKEFIGKELT